MILHAGLVAWRFDGLWRGALLRGASGIGKSDLMLRAVDVGAGLVADDRVLVWRSGNRLYGRAPDTLAGLAEVRGLDVTGCPHLRFAGIRLVVTCQAAGTGIERVYDGAQDTLSDVSLPHLELCPLEASAPAKLRRALERLGGEA